MKCLPFVDPAWRRSLVDVCGDHGFGLFATTTVLKEILDTAHSLLTTGFVLLATTTPGSEADVGHRLPYAYHYDNARFGRRCWTPPAVCLPLRQRQVLKQMLDTACRMLTTTTTPGSEADVGHRLPYAYHYDNARF